MLPLPVQFLIAFVVRTFNERMARRVEHLHKENRILRKAFTEVTGRKRIPLSDDQRLRLAIKGKVLQGLRHLARTRAFAPEDLEAVHQEPLGYPLCVRRLHCRDTGRLRGCPPHGLFVMVLKPRRVRIAGLRVAPDEAWMKQFSRNLRDSEDGFLRWATHLILDRAPLYSAAWRTMLGDAGVQCVRTRRRSPNCSAYAERFAISCGSV